jgi:hypothetical protein
MFECNTVISDSDEARLVKIRHKVCALISGDVNHAKSYTEGSNSYLWYLKSKISILIILVKNMNSAGHYSKRPLIGSIAINVEFHR